MSKLVDRQLPLPPNNVQPDLARYLRDLTSAIANFFREVVSLHNSGKTSTVLLDVLEAAPLEPFDGMIAYADGTEWNPGAGEGFYGYESGAWVKL